MNLYEKTSSENSHQKTGEQKRTLKYKKKEKEQWLDKKISKKNENESKRNIKK